MRFDDERIRDGFPGERLTVIPRPRVERMLESPGTSSLLVTDVGFFPHAFRHGRSRPTPLPQAIIMVCARGRGWVSTDADERTTVAAGQVVVIPPRTPHSYGADDDDPWTLWWLHVAGHLVDDWSLLGGFADQPLVRSVPHPDEIVSLVEEILERLHVDTAPVSLLAASGAAWHLMTLLLVGQLRRSGTTDAVSSTAEYLREHYATRMTVEDLAARVNMSTSHFAALFRARVGQPVHAYITDQRMARARELLDLTSASVADISVAVGYDDPFYFSRHFRKLHGLTPTTYRAQHKG